MICPSCHREIPDDAKFCKYCGKEQNTSEKQKKKGGKMGILAVLLLICVVIAGAGVFAYHLLSGGSGSSGGGKMKKNVFTEYLEYMGTDFTELPDSFEVEQLIDTGDYEMLGARMEMEYAGVEGQIQFIGYHIYEDQELNLPEKIQGMSWLFAEDEEEAVQVLEQMEKDYGEYDGEETHDMSDYLGTEYTMYYWSNRGDENYDITLMLINSEDEEAEINYYLSIVPCYGDSDADYAAPIETFEQACRDRDVELLGEAFADAYLKEEDYDPEVSDGRKDITEDLAGAFFGDDDDEVHIEIEGKEKLSSSYAATILVREYDISISVLANLTEAYVVDTVLTRNPDAEGDDGEFFTIIVGKYKGDWKIIHLEEK